MISSKQLFVAATPGFLKPWWHRMESSPLGYRLARGAFWALTGALISRGLGLFSTFLVGRMLNAHGFGELGMIQSTVGVFGTVAGFGLGMSSTKYVAEFRRVAPSRAGRIIALASATAWVSGSFMAVALFLAASPIAHHILAAPKLDEMLRIGSVLLFLNGINAAQTGSLAGFEAFKTITRVNLVSGLVSFPATLAGVWWAGLHGALWAMVLTVALNCLLNYLALRDEARENAIPIAYRGCFQERHILLHFNLPGVLNSMMLSSSAWVCGAFLVNQLGGYNDMGIYNAAKRVQQLPEVLMGMVMAPFLPVLSEALGRKDMVTYCKTLKMAFSIAALLMIPFSLLQLAAPWITLLPYGETYRGGVSTVQWLMLGSTVYGLLWPVGIVITSLGHMWLAFWLIVLNTVLFVGLGWLLVPGFGAAGYAAAATISLIISNVPSIVFLHAKLGHLLRDLRWTRMACAACCLVTLCWLIGSTTCGWVSLALGLAAAVGFAVWRVVSEPQIRGFFPPSKSISSRP